MNLWDQFLDLLFPPRCPFCGKILDRAGVCPACEKALPWTRDSEGLRTLTGGLRCAAPLWYEGPVRDGILRFKFQGVSGAARPLGELVARCAAERFSGEFDTVAWVPVSRQRLCRRGYDQSELLARAACRLWGVKPKGLLEKTADNPPQSGIGDPAARRANVLGVYRAAEGAEIKDRRILLIDDICTTGATLAACARILKDAGAAEVVCAAAAFARQENVHSPGKNRVAFGGNCQYNRFDMVVNGKTVHNNGRKNNEVENIHG